MDQQKPAEESLAQKLMREAEDRAREISRELVRANEDVANRRFIEWLGIVPSGVRKASRAR